MSCASIVIDYNQIIGNRFLAHSDTLFSVGRTLLLNTMAQRRILEKARPVMTELDRLIFQMETTLGKPHSVSPFQPLLAQVQPEPAAAAAKEEEKKGGKAE